MSLPRFDTKRTAEVDVFAFDFINSLQAGETLVDGGVWTISLAPGSVVADPTPTLTKDGAASVLSVTKSAQRLQGGVSGALYIVACTVATSDARTLQAAALLPVEDESA